MAAAQTGLDETTIPSLRFDDAGLIPAIIQDAADHQVLMFAFMNAEALEATRRTGFTHFWSRSRQKLWKKGETSGETFKVESIRVDCDQDCLLVEVTPQKSGAACHTGRRSCFYRKLGDKDLIFES